VCQTQYQESECYIYYIFQSDNIYEAFKTYCFKCLSRLALSPTALHGEGDIMIGTTISHYKVIEKIGKGGMGEVFLAQDTTLDRKVALKFLPEDMQQDSTARKRFLREAKSAAALDHPFICHIHEVGEAEGKSFISMEYIQGTTLKEKLAEGPLPVKEALEKATEIAEALEAAHKQEIVHRDLKPSNIMLTPQGHVKVMDFGLAKQVTPVEGQEQEITTALTKQGSTLGTVPYMSPEQVRGQEVDTRSDIFSFGVVVYEMLSGVNPFKKGSTMDTATAILSETPPPLTRYTENIPVLLQHTVKKMLAKEADRRFQLIHDVKTDFGELLEESGELIREMATGLSGASPNQVWWRQAAPLILAALIVGVAIASIGFWNVMGPAQPRLVRFAISELPNVSLDTDGTPAVTISPDGTRIVYVGAGHQLYVRTVDQLDAVALRGGVGINPFISPDGNWVGFYGDGGGGTLEKVSIHGGPPVVLTDRMGGIAGAAWGADDSIIFGTAQTNGLFRVSAAGGEERKPLTTLEEGESGHRYPEILPGGRTVLFTVDKGQGAANREIVALNLETGERKLLFPGGSNPHYAATGHIVYGVEGTLRAVPFDLDTVEVKGDPIPVLEGVVTRARGDAHFSLAEDGTLVYVPGIGGEGFGEQTTFVWVDREGREEPVAAEPRRAYQEFSLSPDGTKIAVRVNDPDYREVWTFDLARGTQMRLTFDPASESFPIWTPDGQRVAYGSPGTPLSWKAADGTGEVETLVERSSNQFPQAFSPDGMTLVFEDRNTTSADLGMLSLEEERISTLLLETEFDEQNAALSPDGRWMAYESNESGENEVYVRPFPDVDGGRWQVSSSGGAWPLWSPDGRELFYTTLEGLMTVTVELEPTFTQGTVNLLFDLSPYFKPFTWSNRRMDISPKGDRFLMLKEGGGSDETAETTSIIVVQNWFEELKRLVPTN
jgi:serine/threonine-protein kinase